MGCACQQGRKPNSELLNKEVKIKEKELKDIKIKKLTRMVNFEGNLVPQDAIPQGSLYILGAWYASAESLPEELKKDYGKLFSNKLG